MKYSVITFGCRVNQSDSLRIEERLIASGGREAATDEADVVIVNTCSVTATADQGARQTIRRVARTNPSARIVVTGCYATREPEQVRALPNVQQVIPNTSKGELELVHPLHFESRSPRQNEVTTALRFGGGESSCGAAIEPGIAGRTAYTLAVQSGCDEACSYCIIPRTRGVAKSRSIATALAEVHRVVALGFKEIVLTGVHLGSYGRDLTPPTGLVDLLVALRDEFDPPRMARDRILFRISSLEPMDCSPELVELVGESSCFAPHFHLPLQHASPRMLAAMQRPYSIEYYAGLVDRIRRRIPQASIGTDVIVGFPGESEADFESLAAYLSTSPLTHLHVFPYSDRPGTLAASMVDRPSGVLVKARGARVRDVGAALARAFVESQLGTEQRALTLDDGTLAVTGNFLKVRIPPRYPRNEWVTVRIVSTSPTIVGDLC